MEPQRYNPPARRYAVIAGLLEYTCPGVGAMYAGQIRVGVIWLIATLLGDVALVTLMFVSFFGYAGDYSVITFVLFYVLAFVLFLWLIVRLAMAGSYANAFNEDAQRKWRRQQTVPGS